MYGKYTLFYESPKNWGYLRASTTSGYQASPWGEGPGNEAIQGADLLRGSAGCKSSLFI